MGAPVIPALASARCWCGAHDVGLACPAWVHAAYRADRERRIRECEFIGVQDGELELWNCHCGSTFSVEVES